jgi:hypothetical protein
VSKLVTVSLIVVVILASAACQGKTAGSDLKEVKRVHSGDLDVVLLSKDGKLSHGKDAVTIEFRKGDTLVDVGTVTVGAAMVMAGMPPMLGSVFLEKGDTPGRYKADTDLSMSGGWQLKLEWNGPAGRGSATMQATAE